MTTEIQKTHFADDDTLAYISRLERERAELIEALRVSLRVSSLPFDHADKRANPERLRAILRELGEAE